jgi:hypothetical protein
MEGLGRLPMRQHVVKCDVNSALPNLDRVSSWLDLPRYFKRGSFDVLVADFIHVGDVGKTSQRYGRYVAPENPIKGPSITPLFPDIFDAAEYLLVVVGDDEDVSSCP